jgi:hypothetical protein
MTDFGGTYDYDGGDNFDPGNNEFNPELRNPGFSELLAGFHHHCEEQFGATLDIDPDDDPRSQIFQRAIFAATPNAIATERIARFSGVLSDGRTDFNAEPLLQMAYTTEHAAHRSVVPIALINFFMPIAGNQDIHEKNLEVVNGKVAIAAAFETEDSLRPTVLVFMDEGGFEAIQSRLEEARQAIEKAIATGKAFEYRYNAPSTAAELLIHGAILANQERFHQRMQDDPFAVIEEQGELGEFIFMGIRGISRLSNDQEFDLRIVGNRVKQTESGLYVPEFSGLIEQTHILRLARDEESGLVQALPLEDFTERPLKSAA